MKKNCAGFSTGILACLFATALTASAGVFTDLHDFNSGAGDGSANGVVLSNGQLYGAAAQGGSLGNGLVFNLSTNGSGFVSVHDFAGSPDGSSPNELLLVNDEIYGTTYVAGTNSAGTIYKVNVNHSGYVILRSFTNSPDAQFPVTGLILNDATLYGTSLLGGTNNAGCVFKVDTNGANFAVLHSFTNSPDGSQPRGRLVLNGATLYGTTAAGGSNNVGTAFKIGTNGANYSVIYHFSNTPAATMPYSGLAYSANTLYGTSTSGGSQGLGTVFQMGTNGTGFTIIHNFTNSEGYSPQGSLLLTNNLLYGSTLSQGAGGGGTIFQLGLSGANFTVLKNFTNATDGANPKGLMAFNGNLMYGITGTSGPGGGGTVFQLLLSPLINSQPQGLTVPNGSPASFSVGASDEFTTTYQWYFNTTTLLGGQTSATYNIASVSPGSAGSYTVVVSDNVGSVTSAPAVLTVSSTVTTPNITAQPQSLTVTNGNPATFSVTAANGTLTYQWYFNTNTLIAGQTNSTYTIPVALTNNAGAYTVAVANSAGAVTSSPAVLTVSLNSKPVINTQPQNQTVNHGDTVNFTVVASGLSPLRFQWYSNSVNTAIGVPLAAMTNATLSFATTTNQAGRYYAVVITNTLGKATSSPALLTEIIVPVILTNPQPVRANVGSPATFTVVAIGQGLSYQWYSNSVSTAIGALLAGQTGTSYTFNAITNSNGRYYSVVVSNSFGKATSSPAMLTVATLPYFTLQPSNTTLSSGSSITITSTAAGLGTLVYQWLYQTNLLVAGATNTILTLSSSSPQGYYSLKVTNSYGAVTSSLAMFTISSSPVPTITLQPVSATITNGSPVTFTSAATGSGTLGYQWLYQTNLLIAGATSTSLTFTTANQPGAYSMKVTNSSGAATSSPAILTVIGKPILLSSAFDPVSGSFAFNYVNLAGSTNRLWATTNLADGTAWQALATNFMATNGIWQFTDTNTAQTNAIRLYRFSSP